MSALSIFRFDGSDVRALMVDGEPWFVATDVARVLGYRESYDLTRGLDDDEKGPHNLRTPGGDQSVTIISEAGLYSAVLRSRIERARAFKRWVTHEVLPAIRKTGGYGNAPVEVSRRDLALAILAAEDEADRQRDRADAAESVVKAVEAADGITLREFHKHYFSDVGERDFFELLYKRGYLIDQRGTRIDENGNKKNGKQHAHPSYSGKAWLYLHGRLDGDGIRREHTRVRPGEPEVEFARHLASKGLRLNSTAQHITKEIVA